MEVISPKNGGEISQVANWYVGKTILITGATGFMGKVLVEKLLRSCPEIQKIYLLIRSKKGVDPIHRKDQYFKCVIFKAVLEKNPDIINKIHVVKGDVLESDLGLSINDTNMLISNVDIIFHCAANVRFDQPLRPMIQMNVIGTLKLLKLAEKMINLKVLVHVSTSYCQCNEAVVEERAYPSPIDPYEMIDMINNMDDRALEEITPKLLNGLPNTYALSKAISEDLICKYGSKIPIIITRPSIVTAALSEPLPGWIEGVNGPTGLMIGAARGVIRSMHCNPDYAATIIPVDKAINGMIIAGYDRAKNKSNDVEFCNLCIASKMLFSWGSSIDIGKHYFYEAPLSQCLWYPNGSIKKNYYNHLFSLIFFHYLPAYFIDFWLFLFGKKPFLIRVQNKISTGLKLLQYYTTKEWEFKNEKFDKMTEKLNKTDQERFHTSCFQVNWEEYIRTYILGIRTYIIGEDPATIPEAKKLLYKLKILDVITNFLLYGFIFWFLWSNVDTLLERSDAFIKSSLQIIQHSNNVSVSF